MPTINFPSTGLTPNVSTYSVGNRTWKWNGLAWELVPLTAGFTGSQGNIGYTGSKGDTGFTGSQGNLGYTGSKGDLGYTGSKGDQGNIGNTGYTGSQGDIGYTGSKGDIGYTGSKGDTGFTGSQGNLGYTGSKGDIGYTGSKGDVGFTGSQGDLGYTGSKGNTGLGFNIAKIYSSVAALNADTSPSGIVAGEFAIISTVDVSDTDNSKLYLWNGSTYSFVSDLSGTIGFTGSAGAGYTGSKGDTGFTGSQGNLGYTGSKGDTGYVGSKGDTGFTGSQGDLGYTGSKGDTGYVGSKGDTGFVGSQGYTGSQGNIGYTGSKGDTGYTGSEGNLDVTTSSTPPSGQQYGDIWIDETSGIQYFWYNDGNSDQWVEFANQGLVGFTGSAGSLGFTGSAGSLGFTGSAGTNGYTGSSGGSSWQAIKTSAFNAAAGEGYFVDTTSAAITATLPASPTLGAEITFIDYAGTFDTNNLTVARNGNPIQGSATNLTVSTERSGFTLVFVDGTQGWLLTDK
jgi:hypothetical protein